MSVVCFGVLGSALRFALMSNVPSYSLVEALIASVTGQPCSLKDRYYIATALLKCRRGLSNGEAAPEDGCTGGNRVSGILKAAPLADAEEVTRRVADTVLPLLNPDALKPLCACLLRLVREDAALQSDRAQSFARYMGMPPALLLGRCAVRPHEMIARLLLYCVNCVDNREGASFAESLTRQWFEEASALFPEMRVLRPEDTSVSPDRLCAYLEQALSRVRYVNTVFDPRALSDIRQFYVTSDVFVEKEGTLRDITARHLRPLPPYLYLEAEGGMGKSCMLRHLFVSAAEEYPDCGVPLLAETRAYGGEDVLSFIAQDAAPELTCGEIQTLLREGGCLLMLDGMDEVKPAHLVALERGIADIVKKYPDNRVIVSSRPNARGGMLARFTQMRLCPLREAQSLEVIERMPDALFDGHVKQELCARLREDRHAVSPVFTQNPLLLSILARTYAYERKVPQETHKFYQAAYNSLSHEHDRLKGYYDRPFYTGLDADELKSIIALFCGYAYVDRVYSFSEKDMERYVSAVRCRRGYFKADAASFARDMTENLCVMVRDKGQYRFLHRSFQDWFASLCMAEQESEDLEQLRLHLRDMCSSGQIAGDRALFFLKDRLEEFTVRHLLLPTLEELTEDGFEGFVRREYTTISYGRDTTAERVIMQCRSMLYAFIRESFTTDRFVTLRNMPDVKTIVVEVCIRDTDGRLYDVEDYVAYQKRLEPLGAVYEIDTEDMYADREEYRELICALADRGSALRKEYENALRCRDEMRRSLRVRLHQDVASFMK